MTRRERSGLKVTLARFGSLPSLGEHGNNGFGNETSRVVRCEVEPDRVASMRLFVAMIAERRYTLGPTLTLYCKMLSRTAPFVSGITFRLNT